MPLKGYKQSKEHRAKLKLVGFQKGHKTFISKETYKLIGEKTSKRQKGKPTPKGSGFKKGHKGFGTPESYKLRAKKISKALQGKPQFHQRGEKNNFWKGGVTSINTKIRQSLEMKIWRRAVFERDNYQCVIGGKKHGSKLHADHIKPFAFYPELRFAIDNGRTLCVDCHKKTDTYLKNKN